ncbi:MAG: glycoside hydrolase [Chloroflexi bacterium]|nr:glycoside hydrolase [Chloroflexota bacterium]
MNDEPPPGIQGYRISRRDMLRHLAAVTALITSGGITLGALAQDNRKRIYLAADDHTDLWWSADEATYLDAFVEMIDYYLDLADATASAPLEYQSRWNCDGSYWIWTYEQRKPAAAFARLIARLRDGHISAPLNALVVCLGGAPAEAVLRGMYYMGGLERRFNLRFPIAISMENQTLPYGLAALWAGAGAKYSWKGICGCDSVIANAGDREHEIYWMRGPDGSRILMKWNSMLNGNESIGGYAEARDPAGAVEYVDTNSDFQRRYPYRVIGAFGKGWDDLKTLTDEFVTAARQKTTAARKVIVSNQQDFFADFEQTYGASLPHLACSFGNEWDLYCAALNEVTSRVKRAVEQLRTAEALATIVSMTQPAFMSGRQAARDQAWMSLGLYWEHNFGMDGRSGEIVDQRIAWQRRLAETIERYAVSLYAEAAAALGRQIRRSSTAARFFVFNPLNWRRTDRTELRYNGPLPCHVIDVSNGAEVPSQIIYREGESRLQILAADVPPIGYRVYEVRPGDGAAWNPCATVNGSVIDHPRYRVSVTPRGAISSLIDKERANREFVRLIGGRAINDLGAGDGNLTVESIGPVSVTLRAVSPSPLQHTTLITLTRDNSRIDLHNTIEQNFSATHTWTFGLNIDAPTVWHEEVGAVISADLIARGGHYSPRNARYDWLTLNHFAAINGAGVGVILSNADSHFMRMGNSTVSALDTATPQIHVLAGGHVHIPGKGLPFQGGDTYFLQRFALTTHSGYDQTAAMRFALEHQNPLVAEPVAGGSSYPETQFSFLTVSDPNVLLWALKPHEDGIDKGVVVRLWNMGGATTTAVNLYSLGVASAEHISHIETPIASAPVHNGALQAELAPQQIKTFLLRTATPGGLPPKPGIQRRAYLPLLRTTQSSTRITSATRPPTHRYLCQRQPNASQ